MSRTLAALAALALAATPAAAGSFGFHSDYSSTAAAPTIGAINVSFSPETIREHARLEYPANGAEYISPGDAEDLVGELRDDLEDSLSRTGAYAPMAGHPVGTLNVTILRAQSSNPAHTELGRERNLDFRSVGRGGAVIEAELLAPDGSQVAHYEFRWEESTFDVEYSARIGWWGAERAFERFSNSLASDLTTHEADVTS